MMPRANLLRFSKEIAEWNERCFPGWFEKIKKKFFTKFKKNHNFCGRKILSAKLILCPQKNFFGDFLEEIF